MKATRSLFLASTLLLTALAGCAGDDEALKAAFVATPTDAGKTTFKFDASSSTGSGLKYSWDFGDRSEPKSGEVVEYTYAYPNGAYKVTLTVTDGAGVSQKVTQPVLTGSGQNQAPLLYLTVDKRRATPDDQIFFDASQSTDPDGDPLFFEWDFNAQLEDQQLNDMENLGGHAYGRYAGGKPAPGGASNGTGGTEGERDGLTPSGHDLVAEIEKARQRLYERLGWDQLHGGEPGAAEPRNAELDGRVNDTSPVQFFQYPSNAVYYVHVRVEDIKGEGQEGFIKISIEDAVPAASNTTTLKDSLEVSAIGQVQGTLPGGTGANAFTAYPFKYDYPATSAMTLTYTRQGSQGEEKVAVYVCANANYAECKAGTPKAQLPAGASGRGLTWTVGPGETLPYTYYVIVANEGNAVVDFEFPVASTFDLNPWAKDEAGFGGAHH